VLSAYSLEIRRCIHFVLVSPVSDQDLKLVLITWTNSIIVECRMLETRHVLRYLLNLNGVVGGNSELNTFHAERLARLLTLTCGTDFEFYQNRSLVNAE